MAAQLDQLRAELAETRRRAEEAEKRLLEAEAAAAAAAAEGQDLVEYGANKKLRDAKKTRTPLKYGANNLGTTTPEQWKEMPKIVESIGPMVPGELAHLPRDAPPEIVVAHLYRDGGVIIDEAVSADTCDRVVSEMEPYIN